MAKKHLFGLSANELLIAFEELLWHKTRLECEMNR